MFSRTRAPVLCFCARAHEGVVAESATAYVPCRVPARAQTQVEGFQGERVIQIYAGLSYTVAVMQSGSVYSWGSGANGNLGHPGNEHEFYPRGVRSLFVFFFCVCLSGALAVCVTVSFLSM